MRVSDRVDEMLNSAQSVINRLPLIPGGSAREALQDLGEALAALRDDVKKGQPEPEQRSFVVPRMVPSTLRATREIVQKLLYAPGLVPVERKIVLLTDGLTGVLGALEAIVNKNSGDSQTVEAAELEKKPISRVYKGVQHTYQSPYYHIDFQMGPISESNVNGCQADEIIEVLVKYLSGCNEILFDSHTAQALTQLRIAGMWLRERTRMRELQGVEGTNAPLKLEA